MGECVGGGGRGRTLGGECCVCVCVWGGGGEQHTCTTECWDHMTVILTSCDLLYVCTGDVDRE